MSEKISASLRGIDDLTKTLTFRKLDYPAALVTVELEGQSIVVYPDALLLAVRAIAEPET